MCEVPALGSTEGMSIPSSAEPDDALETIPVQDGIVVDLLDKWRSATARLEEGDDVDTRWARGSAVKLLLQHMAVRESAKNAVTEALRAKGEDQLADRLDGDGIARREAMDRLDKKVRGRQAISLNFPEVDEAVAELGRYFDAEHDDELRDLLPAAERVLGPLEERDLPSARQVRLTSTTHPSPVPKWYDRATPLRAVRAWYQHLRGTPTGGTSPAVDEGREHLPGPGR